MSINQRSGPQTFLRRFVSGSLFVSPCPPECNFQSETKIGPDLRLPTDRLTITRDGMMENETFYGDGLKTWIPHRGLFFSFSAESLTQK